MKNRQSDLIDILIYIPHMVTDEFGIEKWVTDDPDGARPSRADIQPVPSAEAAVIRGALNFTKDLVRMFIGREEMSFLESGNLLRREDTQQTYRVGSIADWGTHLILVCEASS
jgi:hypothetical protein